MCSIGCFRRYYSVLIWIRSFFSTAGFAREYVVRACYIYFDLLRFFFYSGNPRKRNCSQPCIYIIYILFCLIGFMKFSPQLCILFEKNRKTLSIGFYYTIHFILIVFFSDTHVHTRLSSSL